MSCASFEKLLVHLPPHQIAAHEKTIKFFFKYLVTDGVKSHPHPWVRAVGLRMLQASVSRDVLIDMGLPVDKPLLRVLISLLQNEYIETYTNMVPPLLKAVLATLELFLKNPPADDEQERKIEEGAEEKAVEEDAANAEEVEEVVEE